MRGGGFVQGKFNPTNKHKYRGDVNNIVFRSSYELTIFRWLDSEDAVLAWASEELVIGYFDPVTNKKRRYFTDVVAWVKQADGSVKIKVIEIKPEDQTKKPVKTPKEKEETFKQRALEWITNQAKWDAAKEYCAKVGGEFVILTEKQIFPQQHSLKRYKQPVKKK